MHSIFFDLAVILIAARVLAVIAVSLQLPGVIGELLAGLLLGPSMLGLIAPGEVLEILAELGVILLLFKVGLETDASRLVRTGGKAVRIAVAGFLLPFLLGFAYCHLVLGTSLLFAVLVGGTLTATSIGITVRILADIGRGQSDEGQIVVGAAVLDDVLGVVLLAILYDFAHTGIVDWSAAGRITLFTLVFFLIAPLIARPSMALVKRRDAAHRSAGVVPALVIAIVLLFSAFAKAVGVPEVLGGFVAGLAFSRRFFLPFGRIARADLRLATRIEHDTEPIIHILTPIFFVSVGLSVDLRALDLADPQVWMLCLGLFVVAVAGKLRSSLMLGPGAGSRLLIGISMVPRGEVGLIFADLGRDAGGFDASQYAAVVVVIVLTTVLPPLIIPTIARRVTGAQSSAARAETLRR